MLERTYFCHPYSGLYRSAHGHSAWLPDTSASPKLAIATAKALLVDTAGASQANFERRYRLAVFSRLGK